MTMFTRRLLGSRMVLIRRGQIDTGDLVEQNVGRAWLLTDGPSGLAGADIVESVPTFCAKP